MAGNSHEKIEQDPNYQELVRRRSSLGWTLSLIMLIIYFGFILLVAYAPKFLGTPLGTGVTTIGIPIGLFVIVSAFLLTGIYVSKANSKYDPLIRRDCREITIMRKISLVLAIQCLLLPTLALAAGHRWRQQAALNWPPLACSLALSLTLA